MTATNKGNRRSSALRPPSLRPTARLRSVPSPIRHWHTFTSTSASPNRHRRAPPTRLQTPTSRRRRRERRNRHRQRRPLRLAQPLHLNANRHRRRTYRLQHRRRTRRSRTTSPQRQYLFPTSTEWKHVRPPIRQATVHLPTPSKRIRTSWSAKRIDACVPIVHASDSDVRCFIQLSDRDYGCRADGSAEGE